MKFLLPILCFLTLTACQSNPDQKTAIRWVEKSDFPGWEEVENAQYGFLQVPEDHFQPGEKHWKLIPSR
jgi:hypothetical protein